MTGQQTGDGTAAAGGSGRRRVQPGWAEGVEERGAVSHLGGGRAAPSSASPPLPRSTFGRVGEEGR